MNNFSSISFGSSWSTDRAIKSRKNLSLVGGALAISFVTACSGSGPGGGTGAASGFGSTSSVGAQSGTGAADGTGATLGTGATGAGGFTSGSGAAPATGGTAAPGMIVKDDGSTVDCSTLQRPPTPLRRLTRFEYNNAVQDLFGTEATPADSFPPDEIAQGFSNNANVLTISALHAERYMDAAEAIATQAVAQLDSILSCSSDVDGEEVCARRLAESLGRRAYRRALEPEDIEILMEMYAVGDSFEKGVEIMIRAMLQSSHFLFRVEFTGSDAPAVGMVRLNGYETAARLSFLIWSSVPDDELLDAAEAGQLSTQQQVEAAARRMLADPKARAAVTEFYSQWMELNRLPIVTKDVDAFPLWSDAMRAAMQQEVGAVVEHVVWGAEPTLNELLTAPLARPSGPLAELYGVEPSDTVIELAPGQRAGLLTLPGFLSVQAHPDETSAVLRGKFIRSKMFCDYVPPPPDDVNLSPSLNLPEDATARERTAEHAKEPACATCHSLMDPLGLPLENYDAIGHFREKDQGRDLDLSGEFVETSDIDGAFVGPFEMSAQLSTSVQVANCVATQWYKYSAGRGEVAGDACSLSPLQESFVADGANLMELIVNSTQTEEFLYRRATPSEDLP